MIGNDNWGKKGPPDQKDHVMRAPPRFDADFKLHLGDFLFTRVALYNNPGKRGACSCKKIV